MKTGVGYIRISKSEAKSISLDYQKSEVEKLAKLHGYKLISILSDDGISGKDMTNRPGVQALTSLINSKSIDAIFVYKSDRISRNGVQSIMFEALLNSKSVSYFSVCEGLIGDKTEDPLMSYLRAGLNQRERQIIAMRTRSALQKKKESGFKLGAPKYGETIHNGNIVENGSEKLMVERIVQLNRLGYSTRKIAQIATEEGFRTRKQTPISQTQIVRILRQAA